MSASDEPARSGGQRARSHAGHAPEFLLPQSVAELDEKHVLSIFSVLMLAALCWGANGDRPLHGPLAPLFNGSTLNNFDVFLQPEGINNDPDHVFSLEDGMVHVSGKEYGHFITKKEYSKYHLRAEFKWGEGTYALGSGRRAIAEFSITSSATRRYGRNRLSADSGRLHGGHLVDGWCVLQGKDGKQLPGPGGAVRIDHFDKGSWQLEETAYNSSSTAP